jgi:hypothetical protein
MQLVFADSEVAGITVQGGLLRVRFAAAAVEPSGGSGEAGYLLGLDLLLQGAACQGDPAACFGRLAQGTLSDAVSRFTAIELPFDGPGPWQAEFVFQAGAHLVVQATHAAAVPRGDQPFRPSYAC